MEISKVGMKKVNGPTIARAYHPPGLLSPEAWDELRK